MTFLLITMFIAIVVLVVIVVTAPTDDDDVNVAIQVLRGQEDQRKRRLNRLMEAYMLAKEELGEEPTFDQILLTRDSMEDFDGTS